jgi:predicted DNA-binding helix-hairpin-helix protein
MELRRKLAIIADAAKYDQAEACLLLGVQPGESLRPAPAGRGAAARS